MIGVVGTMLGFLLIAALCAGISRLEPDRNGARFNVCYFLAANVIMIPLSAIAYALSASLIVRAGGGLIALPSRGWALLMSAAAFVLLNDFLEYAFHVLQHKLPLLWRLHSLHHSEEAMNATTALRQHWTDGLIRVAVIYTIIGIVFDAGSQVVAIARTIYVINHVFCHMNLRVSWGRFWWLVNSPQYHRCHHSFAPQHIDRNFADLLPLWDLVFRTCHRPAVGEYPATGLQPSVRPTLMGAIVWPLRLPRPSTH